ncbi:unnamed protein product [Penicillium olsonii]|uniref:tRNA-specific adenosine-34 deaminase subunit Tad3 n=1 Tax=Penicillium olsonii TaxID=99116 RepID=A0A9W4HVT6_PENOL|nr:unnamed protein product [Penicillium olsonii]CAG8143119.1 unnamed protein product [Penicillium olsonii]
MDIEKVIRDLHPLGGQVLPIRTVQETRPVEEFADALVAEVNVKAASKVIKALDSAFPKDPNLPLSHLRRFAKREMLPQPLREAIEAQNAPAAPGQTLFVLLSPPLPDVEKLKAILTPFAPTPAPTTPTDTAADGAAEESPVPTIHLHPVKVPLYPPFNTTQAETWTKTLWPVVFNPAAPRSFVAPPPQTLARAQESIEPHAGYYLSLAQRVAQEAEQSGLGRSVGAVIVDPAIASELAPEDNDQTTWDEAVLAVAGDARYSRPEGGAPSQAQQHPYIAPNPASKTYNADLEGGPELHALMRAVELIARWRRENDREGPSDTPESARLSPLESHFLYRHSPVPVPLSPSSLKRKHEDHVSESDIVPASNDLHTPLPAPPSVDHAAPAPATPRIRTRAQGGYLCTDLDVYLSHEPCVCCSMGLLLSRFRAVVFPRGGRLESGGLASEPVVGPVAEDGTEASSGEHERGYYGLHWRKELNWRALGFEFVEDVDVEGDGAVFHA